MCKIDNGKKIILKIGLFFSGFLVIFLILNFVFQPIWFEWNNYDTHKGFYAQPQNTIEVVFLGSSVMVNGITSIKLYEEQGICAYNLATEQQPVLASYFWAKEAYRCHEESLKTIVFDVSTLRYVPQEALYKKAIDNIGNKKLKWAAVKAYSGSFQKEINNFFPFLEYHSRWNDLEKVNFKYNNQSIRDYVRGYNFTADAYIKSTNYVEYIPEYKLDEQASPMVLNDESLKYFVELVTFCEEKEIELLLIKTPYPWDSSAHNAVEELAKKYELVFLDFNFSPLYDELKYNYATDHVDDIHMNYYGANKLTSWLANYLKEHYNLADVREMEQYDFMKEQQRLYKRHVVKTELDNIVYPYEYLQKVISSGDYTVFVVGKDDSTEALSADARNEFKQLGLSKLAELQFRASYLAIIEADEVMYEESALEEREDKKPINKEGFMKNGVRFSISSGGYETGNIASCVIDGKEYAINTRGLNIIVYDNVLQKVVDAAVFDTYSSIRREYVNPEYGLELEINTDYSNLSPVLQNLYAYNLNCKYKKLVQTPIADFDDSEFLIYLTEIMQNEDYSIFISVQDEAANSFNNDVRNVLDTIGLHALSELQYRDSYIGIISKGTVVMEERSHAAEPLYEEWGDFTIISGGMDSGNVSSCIFDEINYSIEKRGINIVVYDNGLGQVIERALFDTYDNVPVIPTYSLEKERYTE